MSAERDAVEVLAAKGLTLPEIAEMVHLVGVLCASERDAGRREAFNEKGYPRYIAVAPEVLDRLLGSLSDPVTVQVLEREGGAIELLCTTHICPRLAGGSAT